MCGRKKIKPESAGRFCGSGRPFLQKRRAGFYGGGKAVFCSYDNLPQPLLPGFSEKRQSFPILWKTHKLFWRSAFFRQDFQGENPGRRGKPGGKCGQPGCFPPRCGCYFGELCIPKTTPCGRRKIMSNCNFSVELPKRRDFFRLKNTLCSGNFRPIVI